jgi:hypothetical protein
MQGRDYRPPRSKNNSNRNIFASRQRRPPY